LFRKSLGSPPCPPSEGCGNSNSEPKEVRLNAAALSNLDSLHTPISFPDHPSLSSTGLVDSGLSHCFVDPEFNSFPSYEIPPVVLRLLDRSVGAIITCATDITIRFSTNDMILLKFYITKLDSTSAFVFGHNWLHRYNLLIDWSAGQITYFRRLPPSVPSSARPGTNSSPEPPVASFISASDPLPSVDSPPISVPLGNSSSSPSISFINAATYARLAHVKGNTIFSISISVSDSVAVCSASVEQVDLSSIPEDYHEFADVFSKSQASTLPPHQSYDLKIDLEEGAEPPLGRMYSLSVSEMSALREFLDENLRNGFVQPSNSSHGTPILFVKKKDGSLRLCVDFRGLNKISKKDRYPLPLISDLLDSPGKARIYTKIDLRHAYHLVCIWEGDKWKTTFRTKYGSFEWLVMPFGLSNAPRAFQHFMNDVFADMLDVCVVVYLDDILIYSSDKATHHKQVKEVLRRLRKHRLYAKPEKCEFDCESVEYLGYILSPAGLTMAADKVQTIQEWPEPRKVRTFNCSLVLPIFTVGSFIISLISLFRLRA